MPDFIVSDESPARTGLGRRLAVRLSKPATLRARAGSGNRTIELVLPGLGASIPVAVTTPAAPARTSGFQITLQQSDNPNLQLDTPIPAALQRYRIHRHAPRSTAARCTRSASATSTRWSRRRTRASCCCADSLLPRWWRWRWRRHPHPHPHPRLRLHPRRRQHLLRQPLRPRPARPSRHHLPPSPWPRRPRWWHRPKSKRRPPRCWPPPRRPMPPATTPPRWTSSTRC
ncbi:hypothetical protein FSC37_21365 [Piscinibacter aquaticus]|uniref:Uncharacterized protein n=1 Tax=Piscinibacter aquaticus TaxID=392597 RepID=A0A5C6U5C2_9BURK|nr:hypothetical protein FSC37_21365 [Piscinibacter aquaticus]